MLHVMCGNLLDSAVFIPYSFFSQQIKTVSLKPGDQSQRIPTVGAGGLKGPNMAVKDHV